MKEWKKPNLSNLDVSQTMDEVTGKSVSWKCECTGCDYVTAYYPDKDEETGVLGQDKVNELKAEHMRTEHINGCFIS